MANQYPGTDRLFNVGASSGGGWGFASAADFLNDKAVKAGQLGVAQEGDYFFDTTFKVIRLYRDGDWPIYPSQVGSSEARAELYWVAGERGKPGINADIQNASEAVRMIADPYFELQGNGIASGSSVLNSGGGLTLTNQAGAANRQCILVGHADASQSPWGTYQFSSSKSPRWGITMKTGPSIANMTLWIGLKLTTSMATATDNEQIFFRYENGVGGGNWQAINSVVGNAATLATSVTVATTTKYTLEIAVDEDRVGRMFINGELVKSTLSSPSTPNDLRYLSAMAALIPVAGLSATNAGDTKSMFVFGQWASMSIS